MVSHRVLPKTTTPVKEVNSARKSLGSRAKSAQASQRQLDMLAHKISEESKRKAKLRQQMDEIRSNMSQYQASLAGDKKK